MIICSARLDGPRFESTGTSLRSTLKAGDIDSAQNIIRVVQSKGRKDRHVMLPPEVLSLLRQWWKVRPTQADAGAGALLPMET
jgi:integrase